MQPDRAQLEADLARRHYLLDEIRGWSRAGLIDAEVGARLSRPYETELSAIVRCLAPDVHNTERPAAPACHAHAGHDAPFCPDCGVSLADRQRSITAPVAAPIAAPVTAPVAAPPALLTEAPPVVAPQPAPVAPAPVWRSRAAEPEPVPEEPAAPRRAERLLRELRPVFYENFVLFLGAFLVFAGSVYFAIYFWARLGLFGPLVAGGLLAVYGLGFAGAGYVLQRRYHAELSARVLYGVATAILPVASTLLGEPLHTGGVATGVLAFAAVSALAAIAYPAIYTAASLFQRDIGKPFARAFVALLWGVGMAPAVATTGQRGLAIVYIYLAAVPLIAMYRRVREVGRVFERATVVYVVGGSAYMVAAVAVRVSLAVTPGIEPAELAPLLVLVATAAMISTSRGGCSRTRRARRSAWSAWSARPRRCWRSRSPAPIRSGAC